MSGRHRLADRGARRWLGLVTSVLTVASAAACSLLLDRNAAQCQTDADCAGFGGRPLCQGGVCADLGEGPPHCFYGSPSQPTDFLNQCGDAGCLSFDDCARLGLCNGTADPPLITPPLPEASTSTDAGPTSDAGLGLPSCADATQGRGKVVYITGSSNFPPLLAKLAPLVLESGYTPVFLTTNSCTGVKSMLSTAAPDRTIADPAPGSPASKYAQYFDATGMATSCSLGSAQVVNVGESDVFSEDCDPFKSASSYPGVIESFGPIQAMAFIVNSKSNEVAISEQAARDVFGRGAAGQPNIPWTQPARYFVRNAGTGTQQMIGHAINVDAKAFWGVDTGTADRVFAAVANLGGTDATQGIGIISVDYYDKDRVNLRALAYRADQQTCAYLPDSDAHTYDKRNVRDGHYPIWGPVHFYSVPGDDAASAFLAVISAMSRDPRVLDAFIGASLVPLCAMSVQRLSEIGPLSSFSPAAMCDCYFEYKAAMVHGQTPHLPAECVPCGDGLPACPASRQFCNIGYCEVQ